MVVIMVYKLVDRTGELLDCKMVVRKDEMKVDKTVAMTVYTLGR